MSSNISEMVEVSNEELQRLKDISFYGHSALKSKYFNCPEKDCRNKIYLIYTTIVDSKTLARTEVPIFNGDCNIEHSLNIGDNYAWLLGRYVERRTQLMAIYGETY